MLSTVAFSDGLLSVQLSNDDAASVHVSNGTVEVSVNGTVTGPSPDASTVSSIDVTAGNGNNSVDLSAVNATEFPGLSSTGATINMGGGDDSVTGSQLSDAISGGDGNDLLQGEGGDDVINGDGGTDIINGGDGDDILWSGTGSSEPDGGTLDGDAGQNQVDGANQGGEVEGSGGTPAVPGDPMPDDWTTIGNGFPTTRPPVNTVRLIIATRDGFHSFIIVQTTNDQFFFYRGGEDTSNNTLEARRGIYGVSNPSGGTGSPVIDHEAEPFYNRTEYRVVGGFFDDDVIADLDAAITQIDGLNNAYTANGNDNCHSTSTAILKTAGLNTLPASPYPSDASMGVTVGWGQLPTGFVIP